MFYQLLEYNANARICYTCTPKRDTHALIKKYGNKWWNLNITVIYCNKKLNERQNYCPYDFHNSLEKCWYCSYYVRMCNVSRPCQQTPSVEKHAHPQRVV